MGRIRRWVSLFAFTLLVAACATTQDAQDEEIARGGPIVTQDAQCSDGTVIDPYRYGTLTLSGTGETDLEGDGVQWEIYLPADWNKWWFTLFNGARRLVVFHQGTIDPYTPLDTNGLPQLPNHSFDTYNEVVCNLVTSNIALAWTSNTEYGYDISGAYHSTLALIDEVKAQLSNDPSRWYQVGFSQGGIMGPLFLEQSNPVFHGGLSICAPLDGMTSQLQYLGDARVLFDAYFQGNYAADDGIAELIPVDADDATSEQPSFSVLDSPDPPRWEITYVSKSDGTLAFDEVQYGFEGQIPPNLPAEIRGLLFGDYTTAREMAGVDQIDLPRYSPNILVYSVMETLYYAVRGVNQLKDKVGGVPYDNRGTSYTRDDVLLDRTVLRYEGVPTARAYVREWFDPAGQLNAPLVTLHTWDDPAVPYWHEQRYESKVENAQATSSLRQLYARRVGHCIFPQDELIAALDHMIRWVEFGDGPIPEDVTTTNDAPYAYAGENMSGTAGTPVSLDGSESADPNRDAITFTWTLTVPSGSSAVLSNSTSATPTFTPDLAGDYVATLTVSDGILSSTDSTTVSATGTAANSSPAASFTYSCTQLTCDFTDTSTDSDGSIKAWSWSFGDGASSTAQSPSHTYASGGTYTVSLTVTDNGGATGSSSQDVTVTAPSSGGISLSVNGYKVKGNWTTDLTWSGATSTNVDVRRNGAIVATTANDGAYTDSTNLRGGGSLTYQVCEADTETCSPEVRVVF